MDPSTAIYLRALVMAAPVALILTWGFAKNPSHPRGAGSTLIRTGLIIVYSASGASASFTFALNATYGIIHYVFVLLSAVLILLMSYEVEAVVEAVEDHLITSWFAITAPLVALTVAVPLAVMPHFRPHVSPEPEAISATISAESFTRSFSRIRDALNEIESKISLEAKDIDKSITDLAREIETRNDRLQQLQTEQSRLAQQVKYYEELASLTKPQVEAVVGALHRGKYVDYGIGFIIGMFCSGFFFAMHRLTSGGRKLPMHRR